MNHNPHPSDSSAQQQAELIIIQLLNAQENLSLKKHVAFLDNIQFQFDGYSDSPPILCVIYSCICNLKPAQCNKVAKDMLKMLLMEKLHPTNHYSF